MTKSRNPWKEVMVWGMNQNELDDYKKDMEPLGYRTQTALSTEDIAARTTGFTSTLALRMIARGLYRRKGISAPEFIGQQPACVKFMRKGLKDRGIVYKETIETIKD